MSEIEAMVQGKGLKFPDGRGVDLFDLGDSYTSKFTQTDGVVTRVRLSYEAMAALVRLYIEANNADCVFIEDGMPRFGRMHP